MALRINPKSPLLEEKRNRVSKLPIYGAKNAAINAAVVKIRGDNTIIEVWKSPEGKFVTAPFEVWEDLYQLGYDRVVDSLEIHDIATGRIDEIEEV